MHKAELLERYHALPLPDTTMEHWRFTDLRGFDPDSFVSNGHVQGLTPATSGMLDIDVAGIASVSETRIEIGRAPEGITFAPLDETHEHLYSLVG